MAMIGFLIALGVLSALVVVVIGRSRLAPKAPTPPRPAAPDVPPDLANLDETAFRSRLVQEIAAGRTIVAIKWVRARTGLGLKEAKDVVDALIAGDVGAPLERPVAPTPPALDEIDFQARLLVELAAGRKIEAIRLYRERTGVDLKDAKDAVEALERDN